MAKIDKVLCPLCMFVSKYISLSLSEEGFYMCPHCNATFSYEELMQLYSYTQLNFELREYSNDRPA